MGVWGEKNMTAPTNWKFSIFSSPFLKNKQQ